MASTRLVQLSLLLLLLLVLGNPSFAHTHLGNKLIFFFSFLLLVQFTNFFTQKYLRVIFRDISIEIDWKKIIVRFTDGKIKKKFFTITMKIYFLGYIFLLVS